MDYTKITSDCTDIDITESYLKTIERAKEYKSRTDDEKEKTLIENFIKEVEEHLRNNYHLEIYPRNDE